MQRTKRKKILYKVCASREKSQIYLSFSEAPPKLLLVLAQVKNLVTLCKLNPAVCLHGYFITSRYVFYGYFRQKPIIFNISAAKLADKIDYNVIIPFFKLYNFL